MLDQGRGYLKRAGIQATQISVVSASAARGCQDKAGGCAAIVAVSLLCSTHSITQLQRNRRLHTYSAVLLVPSALFSRSAALHSTRAPPRSLPPLDRRTCCSTLDWPGSRPALYEHRCILRIHIHIRIHFHFHSNCALLPNPGALPPPTASAA